MGVHFVGVKGAEWRAEISSKKHSSSCFILCYGSAFTFSFTFPFCLRNIVPNQMTYHDTCFSVSMTGVITGAFLFSQLLILATSIHHAAEKNETAVTSRQNGFPVQAV